MRAKFEKMCREAQDAICKAVEEVDGEGKFQ
jgi:coproporphyrinogen III oxidase